MANSCRSDAAIKPLEAVLFDLDGTLIDSGELIRTSFRYATRKVLGRTIPDHELFKLVGQPLPVQMAEFDNERTEELVETYRAHNHRVHDRFLAYFPGTREVLEALQIMNIPMGVVTSKKREVALRGLKRFDLEGFFELLIGSDDVMKHKPDPYPLEVAAQRMSVSLDTCIYIGDSPFDMVAAKRGGALAVAATWGMFSEDELVRAGADRTLARITELPPLVSSLT